jgi:thioredoxin-like negative regulator of GroEL
MAPDVQTVIDDNPYFSVQKINIDSPSAQAKMERYGVESAPTLVFVFYSQVIGRLDGLQDRAALQTMVDTLVDREIRPKS